MIELFSWVGFDVREKITVKNISIEVFIFCALLAMFRVSDGGDYDDVKNDVK
jgi:hypothetical protein